MLLKEQEDEQKKEMAREVERKKEYEKMMQEKRDREAKESIAFEQDQLKR